jgi:hypothetical protein
MVSGWVGMRDRQQLIHQQEEEHETKEVGSSIKEKLYKNYILFLKLKVKSKYKFYTKFLSLYLKVQT